MIGRSAFRPVMVKGHRTTAWQARLEPAAFPASLDDLRARTPPGFSVGHSVDWKSAEALLAGGDAWYSVAAGLFPTACRSLAKAAQTRDGFEVRSLNARLQPLCDLFVEHSSLRVVHAAANLLGLCRTNPPRPILPLADDVQRRMSRVLEELELT